jgi:hypothetical protein
MNDSKPITTARCHASDGEPSTNRKSNFSISSDGHSSTYFSRNVSGCTPSYLPVYYPGSYTHLRYPSEPYYNHPVNPVHYNNIDLSMPSNMTMTLPSPHNRSWNRINLPSPLTTSATTKGTSSPKPRAKASDKNGPDKNLLSSPPMPSKSRSSNEYVDPKILEAANALELPPGGQKYSVAHWKGAMRLCYRWKTTTNEQERQFFRTSTTTNSLSSSTLKSIKNFCENILMRKSKRRQFAIHWKESGLKKIIEEVSSSENALFGYNDPKLERVIDDYFSGRTRSTGYNQAKEKALDDRQKEILYLWDELMSGPILSDALSHQKLYLIQLAIERPYRNKKVEIENMDQKIIHDVSIEGYGGKSYWEANNASLKGHEKPDTLSDPVSKSLDGGLPMNEAMIKRFWKCADSFCTSERQGKRRRMENGDESKISQQLSQRAGTLSKMSLNTRENVQLEEDKENERLSVVAV